MKPLLVAPRLSARVWGGHRLGQAEQGEAIGESWVLHEEGRVLNEPYAGRTLAELAAEFPAELLGERAQGRRFPLLIKLLDCQDWLSVQVHPNDAQAARLVGPGELGKTEAWYVLDAAPGAQLIAGVRAGTSPAALRQAILNGQIMDHAEYQAVHAGDTVFMPAGTLHALGPGLFIYEVQQTSDTTYRVYDWDRPASAGRALHLAHSAEVTTTTGADLRHAAPLAPGERRERVHCAYFVLDELRVGPEPLELDTAGESFHALTLISGQGRLHAGGEILALKALDSVLLPASLGRYKLEGASAQALLSRLP